MPATDALLTIAPPPCATIIGTTACDTRYTERKFTASLPVPGVLLDLMDLSGLEDAGIVEEDVDAPVGGGDTVDKAADVVAATDVRRHNPRRATPPSPSSPLAAARARSPFGRARRVLTVEVGDHGLGALVEQASRDGQPDTGGAARHHGDEAGEALAWTFVDHLVLPRSTRRSLSVSTIIVPTDLAWPGTVGSRPRQVWESPARDTPWYRAAWRGGAMEEPAFPFYGDGDESRAEHCFDCGKVLPDEGDPAVIYVRVTRRDGIVEVGPPAGGTGRGPTRALAPSRDGEGSRGDTLAAFSGGAASSQPLDLCVDAAAGRRGDRTRPRR